MSHARPQHRERPVYVERLWEDLLCALSAQPAARANECRRLVEALEQAQMEARELRAILESSAEGILVLDTQGRVLKANAAAAGIAGREQGIEGASLEELTEDAAHAKRFLRRVQRQGRRRGLLRLRRPDGSLRLAEYSASPDFLTGRHLVLLRDETEQRLAQRAAWQARRLESLGRLVGGVAHDFNNLLTAVLLYSGLLGTELGPRSRLQRHLEEIQAAADRGAALVAQLLAFASRQPAAPRYLSLNQVLEQMGEMLRRLLGERVELALASAQSLGLVKADLGQVEQMILNLALNARDAMPEGGRLILETANLELTESHPLLGAPAGSYVLLRVSDSGYGMDEPTRARIFEPFFTTKEGNTGLGLATVYGAVKQAQGWIGVDSQPGQGTSVSILLPRTTSAQEALQPVRPAPRGPMVMLVEDDDAVRRSLGEALGAAGMCVLPARDAREALQVNQRTPVIDLLVTDLALPGMNGRELAETLVRQRPGLSVLYVTGNADPRLVSGLEPGLLRKPFTCKEFMDRVLSVLRPGQARGEGGGGSVPNSEQKPGQGVLAQNGR